MANKLFSKAKGVAKGTPAPAPAAAPRDMQSLQRDNRAREIQMMEKLKFLLTSIEHSPDIQLKQDKIKQFLIPQRLAKMIRSLDTTRVTEMDESGLDAMIMYFINCLETALKNGYENMAYWSSIAVHHSTETLHIPVPKSDVQFAAMLYDRKYKYAQTLALVIEEARAVDVAQEKLEAYNAQFDRERQELQRRKERHEAVKQSRGGVQLIQSARQKINDRGSMTEEEQEIFDNLLEIRRLSKSLKATVNMRTIEMDALKTHDAAVQKYQAQLRDKPTVEDEKIAARMKTIDTYFLEQLDARVSRTLAIEKMQDEFYAGLQQIASRVDRANAQRVSETLDKMEMEAVDLRIAARENAEMAKRIRDNQRQLERMEQILQESIQALEEEEQQEIQSYQEAEAEEETETELETEVEEEFG